MLGRLGPSTVNESNSTGISRIFATNLLLNSSFRPVCLSVCNICLCVCNVSLSAHIYLKHGKYVTFREFESYAQLDLYLGPGGQITMIQRPEEYFLVLVNL